MPQVRRARDLEREKEEKEGIMKCKKKCEATIDEI